ncbi:ABC transporter ATP-binding protein [Marinomonas rhizomae]|uniref:Peptide/nickel transport system ATP-binding protein n=1 Tax=Marinomonas rhizomae TaxID=491948 RepID=A0A366J0I1_9GAMM|nr:ATP-binding cassette domain-containing protein [Marinomonas rhizomae]RBP80573.1 peptide/nickel transport system ATP-binding protein [Marinomonas rhizomae]RNF71804.1 ABC transporter ATP-binding protein [Marinomonas rhizomae]
MNVLLKLTNVAVYVGDTCLLEPISLSLNQGQPLTILGQTGSGKSLLAQAIMGLLPADLRVSGEIEVFGEVMALEERQALWGREMVMLPQEPWHSLDPLMKGVDQVKEVYQFVREKDVQEALALANDDLRYVGLEGNGHKRPDELSGGMAQRLAITAATAGGAHVILADEPTKGLDVSRRDGIVQLLQARSNLGSLLTITHDVTVARQLGGVLLVIKKGRLVEQGEATQILDFPQDNYTRELIAAEPCAWSDMAPTIRNNSAEDILTADNLRLERGGRTLFDGLSFSIKRGEVVGIVGDSGCGKSSLGDALLDLLPISAGKLTRINKAAKPHQWLKLYQDPPSAFSASVSLGQLLDDLVTLHGIDKARIAPLMSRLSLPQGILTRNCLAVSGGELQRFAILRALLLDPVFLFADEPTSRLDPITAKEVTTLLVELASDAGCAVLLVSHDAALLQKTCHQVIAI